MAIHRIAPGAEDFERYFRRVLGGDGPRGAEAAEVPWSVPLQEIMDALERVAVGRRARPLAWELGYAAGLEGSTRLAQAVGPHLGRLELFLAMPYLVAGAGSGTGEFVFDDEGLDLTWTFQGGTPLGVAARRAGGHTEGACTFLEGLGTGWAEGSLDVRLRVVETDCVGTGRSLCRFVSRPGESVTPGRPSERHL